MWSKRRSKAHWWSTWSSKEERKSWLRNFRRKTVLGNLCENRETLTRRGNARGRNRFFGATRRKKNTEMIANQMNCRTRISNVLLWLCFCSENRSKSGWNVVAERCSRQERFKKFLRVSILCDLYVGHPVLHFFRSRQFASAKNSQKHQNHLNRPCHGYQLTFKAAHASGIETNWVNRYSANVFGHFGCAKIGFLMIGAKKTRLKFTLAAHSSVCEKTKVNWWFNERAVFDGALTHLISDWFNGRCRWIYTRADRKAHAKGISHRPCLLISNLLACLISFLALRSF